MLHSRHPKLGMDAEQLCGGRYILTLKGVYSKRFYHNILNEIHSLELCISATDFLNLINTEDNV